MKARVNKDGLPKYLFARGQRIWVRYKNEIGEWTTKPSPYTIDQVDLAKRFVAAIQKGIAQKMAAGELPGEQTVRSYAKKWLDDRDTRGVASAATERSRLEKFAFPYVGDLALEAVTSKDIVLLLRALKAMKDPDGRQTMANRSIIHVYTALHGMFAAAMMDNLVPKNPVKVPKEELPRKIDKDPEWRMRATYTVKEVVRLISEPVLPVERRVQYALKALAGLRHGEIAALCWRHLDQDAEPLYKLHIVQAFCSAKHIVKSTKTEETRTVPVHPVLARILKEWREDHWARIYGRPPKDDDFVVPARTMRPINVGDAGESMKRDLGALGLRIPAGKDRDRGGHDLRSWYETRLIEDGADSLLIRRTTHAPPKDVAGGYERFAWKTLCREIEKLQVPVPEGKILVLVTASGQVEQKAGNRWRSSVTPLGLEPKSLKPLMIKSTEGSKIVVGDTIPRDSSRSKKPANPSRDVTKMMLIAAQKIERASLTGDIPRMLEIARELREIGTSEG